MTTRQTFNTVTIQCPACWVKVPLVYPNPRLYTAARRDPDGRPAEYRWLAGHDASIKPHYYTVWQCPQCLFANLVESVMNPRGAKENYLREAYKHIAEDALMFLSRLSSLVPKEGMDLKGAMAKHLAALITTVLPGEDKIDHNKLGRLYLRLGWLYREANLQVKDDTPKSLTAIKNCSRNITDLLTSLRASAMELNNTIKTRSQELADQNRSNPYEGMMKSLGLKINDLISLSSALQRSLETDEKSTEEKSAISSAGEFSVLKSAMVKAKQRWECIPLDEEESLRMSADAYEHAFKVEKAYPTAEKAMSAISLLIKILRQIGNRTKALELINFVAKGGISSKQDLSEKFAKIKAAGLASLQDQKRMRDKLSVIDNTILELSTIRVELLGELLEEQKELIESTLSECEAKSVDEKKEALLEGGVSPYLISDLSHRGLLKKGKKKSIFS